MGGGGVLEGYCRGLHRQTKDLADINWYLNLPKPTVL